MGLGIISSDLYFLIVLSVATSFFLWRIFFSKKNRHAILVICLLFTGGFFLDKTGTFLNELVIRANHGQMPVDERAIGPLDLRFPLDARHFWADQNTRLPFLIDKYYGAWLSPGGIASIGDIMQDIGSALLCGFCLIAYTSGVLLLYLGVWHPRRYF